MKNIFLITFKKKNLSYVNKTFKKKNLSYVNNM